LIGNKTEQVTLLSANASKSLSVDRSRARPPEIFLDDPAAPGLRWQWLCNRQDGAGTQSCDRIRDRAEEPVTQCGISARRHDHEICFFFFRHCSDLLRNRSQDDAFTCSWTFFQTGHARFQKSAQIKAGFG
jgi:hypothetical protein